MRIRAVLALMADEVARLASHVLLSAFKLGAAVLLLLRKC